MLGFSACSVEFENVGVAWKRVGVAMPLASVEEWRARIGSCWCALGRPLKASKSSGDYRSFAVLSGSAMLQAVYALMVMVLALTRDTAVVFIRGAESINGCVNECQRQIKSELMMTRVYQPPHVHACPSTSSDSTRNDIHG